MRQWTVDAFAERPLMGIPVIAQSPVSPEVKPA